MLVAIDKYQVSCLDIKTKLSTKSLKLWQHWDSHLQGGQGTRGLVHHTPQPGSPPAHYSPLIERPYQPHPSLQQSWQQTSESVMWGKSLPWRQDSIHNWMLPGWGKQSSSQPVTCSCKTVLILPRCIWKTRSWWGTNGEKQLYQHGHISYRAGCWDPIVTPRVYRDL